MNPYETEYEKLLYTAKTVVGTVLSETEKKKKAIFTAGIPGSGKTTMIMNIGEKEDLSGYLMIDPDALRRYLPYYDELVEKFPSKASALSQRDAGLLASLVRNEALERGLAYILDSTLGTENAVEVEIGKALKAGYDVKIVLKAVSPEEAYLMALYRYRLGVGAKLQPRYVNSDYITARAESIKSAMDLLEKKYGENVEIKIYGRDANGKTVEIERGGEPLSKILENEEKRFCDKYAARRPEFFEILENMRSFFEDSGEKTVIEDLKKFATRLRRGFGMEKDIGKAEKISRVSSIAPLR